LCILFKVKFMPYLRKVLSVILSILLIISVLLVLDLTQRADLEPRRGRVLQTPPGGPLIVGGDVARSGTWPWQVALVDPYYFNDFDGQFCGGSLIAEDWVLTAAHCVQDEESGKIDDPQDIRVVVGRLRLSSSVGQKIAVQRVIPHPDFYDTGNEDIALLELAEPAVLNSNVQPISLLANGKSFLARPGVMAVTTGWGLTVDGDDDTASDILRQAAVPVVSYDTCQEAYDREGTKIIDAMMICAGGNRQDSCQGDSGGPLVVPKIERNGYELAGVVSFGHTEGCAAPDTFGVYTRVSAFVDWVTSYTGPLEPQATPTPSPTPDTNQTPTPTVQLSEQIFLPVVLR
jgi:secreted trypsin-like serine protease